MASMSSEYYAAVAGVALFTYLYREEVKFWFSVLGRFRNLLVAKKKYPPVVHEVIQPWAEPKSREELFGDKRIIWGYWAQGEGQLPGMCQIAVQSWRVHHPGWEVVILSEDNYKQYVSHKDLPNTFNHLKMQHRSDVVRLAVLRRYGGLYLDASYVLFHSMDELWDRSTKSGDFFLTAPVLIPCDGRPEPLLYPNNAFLLAAMPENPVIVTFQKKLLDYMENPAYNKEEMRAHPLMSRVKEFIGHSAFGPAKDIAPYFCNLFLLFDTLYFDSEVRSYVKEHVFILPTLMWTFDFYMIYLSRVPVEEAPSWIAFLECWSVWFGRIPYTMPFVFKTRTTQKLLEDKLEVLMNAVKISSDLYPWWDLPIEFHLSQPNMLSRLWRRAVDTTKKVTPANLDGICHLVPFDEDEICF